MFWVLFISRFWNIIEQLLLIPLTATLGTNKVELKFGGIIIALFSSHSEKNSYTLVLCFLVIQ